MPTLITQLDCEQADVLDRNRPRARLLSCGGGLGLQITPGKVQADGSYALAKSWLFSYRFDGIPHGMGLGPFASTVPGCSNSPKALTLAEAQVQARIHANQLKDGTDPLTHEQTKKLERLVAAQPKARKTFQAVADEYMDKHEAGWSSPVTRAQWRETMALHVYPKIGRIPVAHITDEHVLKVLEPLWESKKANTGKKLCQRIAKVLGYAIAMKYRKGPNPAEWRDGLQFCLARPTDVRPVKKHPAVKYPLAMAFMSELRQEPGTNARMLEFVMLTGVRSAEARGAKWSEIDLTERLWTIPKARTKMRRDPDRDDHKVPLSVAAIAVLTILKGNEEPDPNALVFAGRFGDVASDGGMRCVLRRVGGRIGLPHATPHGMRSTLRTWAQERATEFPDDVAEACLAHYAGGVKGRYARADFLELRRGLLEKWAGYVCPEPGNNIVPLRRSA
jgi:integrase